MHLTPPPPSLNTQTIPTQPPHPAPPTTTALLSAAARALLDASTGRYLYRQATAAYKAVSASPSPARSRRVSESPEPGAARPALVAARRRRASLEGLLPPLAPPRPGSGVVGVAPSPRPLTRSRSGAGGAG